MPKFKKPKHVTTDNNTEEDKKDYANKHKTNNNKEMKEEEEELDGETNEEKFMGWSCFSISEEVNHSTDPNIAAAILHTIQQQKNLWESESEDWTMLR